MWTSTPTSTQGVLNVCCPGTRTPTPTPSPVPSQAPSPAWKPRAVTLAGGHVQVWGQQRPVSPGRSSSLTLQGRPHPPPLLQHQQLAVTLRPASPGIAFSATVASPGCVNPGAAASTGAATFPSGGAVAASGVVVARAKVLPGPNHQRLAGSTMMVQTPRRAMTPAAPLQSVQGSSVRVASPSAGIATPRSAVPGHASPSPAGGGSFVAATLGHASPRPAGGGSFVAPVLGAARGCTGGAASPGFSSFAPAPRVHQQLAVVRHQSPGTAGLALQLAELPGQHLSNSARHVAHVVAPPAHSGTSHSLGAVAAGPTAVTGLAGDLRSHGIGLRQATEPLSRSRDNAVQASAPSRPAPLIAKASHTQAIAHAANAAAAGGSRAKAAPISDIFGLLSSCGQRQGGIQDMFCDFMHTQIGATLSQAVHSGTIPSGGADLDNSQRLYEDLDLRVPPANRSSASPNRRSGAKGLVELGDDLASPMGGLFGLGQNIQDSGESYLGDFGRTSLSSPSRQGPSPQSGRPSLGQTVCHTELDDSQASEFRRAHSWSPRNMSLSLASRAAGAQMGKAFGGSNSQHSMLHMEPLARSRSWDSFGSCMLKSSSCLSMPWNSPGSAIINRGSRCSLGARLSQSSLSASMTQLREHSSEEHEEAAPSVATDSPLATTAAAPVAAKAPAEAAAALVTHVAMQLEEQSCMLQREELGEDLPPTPVVDLSNTVVEIGEASPKGEITLHMSPLVDSGIGLDFGVQHSPQNSCGLPKLNLSGVAGLESCLEVDSVEGGLGLEASPLLPVRTFDLEGSSSGPAVLRQIAGVHASPDIEATTSEAAVVVEIELPASSEVSSMLLSLGQPENDFKRERLEQAVAHVASASNAEGALTGACRWMAAPAQQEGVEEALHLTHGQQSFH
mmetsp:Transcript_107139/g.345967  ORF Transcript_107139/g.345967 Transcript_107139/m.345967 type:complete len:902 (-) Transcript_107139:157-2862(-)